jgi:F-type H+-transporting ATPase subunit b
MDFDLSLLAVLVVFGITYAVLRAFLFTPLYALLRRREAEIDTAAEIHQQTFADTQAQLDAERGRLAEARANARAGRDALRQEAQAQRMAVLAAAKSEAEKRLEAAQGELAEQVERERSGLEARVSELAAVMTERLLGRAS